MKKLILLSVFFAIYMLNVSAKTTFEQYKYLQIGLREAINKGYQLREDIYCTKMKSDTIANKECTTFKFAQDDEVIAYVYKFFDSKGVECWICVPTEDAEIEAYETFTQMTSKLTKEQFYIFSIMLSRSLSFI